MSESHAPKPLEGFTLVEVIVAMLIFALVIAGGMIGLSKGFEFVDASRHYTRASQVLQSELELLRTLPWETFDAKTDAELEAAFQAQIVEQFGAGVYTGTLVTSTSNDVRKVVLNVQWTGRTQRVYSVNFTTFFTEGGLNDYYAPRS